LFAALINRKFMSAEIPLESETAPMTKASVLCSFLLLAACSPSPSSNSAISNALSNAGSSVGGDGSVSNPPTIETPLPGSTPATASNLICASLGSGFDEGIGCRDADKGLKGSIYVLEQGYSGPEIQMGYIFANGVRLPQDIQMTNFNVPARSFTEGFPLSNGTLLTGPSGNPILEWFAFDLKGYFTLKAPYASGQYQFAVFIDDGAIIRLDDQVILNADGYHSPQWLCQQNPVTLNLNDRHTFGLQYFQGPKTEIALRLMMRPYNPNLPCNDQGGFVPVPHELISN
jgi:hypothetical protein